VAQCQPLKQALELTNYCDNMSWYFLFVSLSEHIVLMHLLYTVARAHKVSLRTQGVEMGIENINVVARGKTGATPRITGTCAGPCSGTGVCLSGRRSWSTAMGVGPRGITRAYLSRRLSQSVATGIGPRGGMGARCDVTALKKDN
jgi:hypothetical protein